MLALALAASLIASSPTETVLRRVAGWNVRISQTLLSEEPDATAKALRLLDRQLREVARLVPAPAVAKLRKVTLWMSPTYPDTEATAEYHPGEPWLRENGRNPAMVKGVEFTNVLVFEEEYRRMPNFALHELAHAYHDQFLPGGFRNPEILAAFEQAKKSGVYDRVERRDSQGRSSFDRAYALTNRMEYFAETTEAFFSTNDFFPFNRQELLEHDPEMHDLLEKLWSLP